MNTRNFRIQGVVAFALIATLVISMAGIAMAGAVGTAAGFEDDDGNLAPASPINFDWNSFSPTTWTGNAPYRQSTKLVPGWNFTGIEDAQATNSDSAFAGGTKQDDNCATVIQAKAPNKDDLKRIYVSHKRASNGDIYLMLGWVRIPQNTTSPSAHVGFEFNQGTTACGGSSNGLVQRTAGDMLIVYDFEGGGTNTPVITLRQWVTTGACEVSSDSAPCWGPATNLTELGFAEAKVNTDGSVSDAIAPSSETLGTNEFGEAGINLTGAGVFSANTCQSFGKVFGVSRSSGNSGTAQMKDLVGPGNINITNCGSVIIRKVTDPANGTNFGFTKSFATFPASANTFSLNDGGSTTFNNVPFGTGYTVVENSLPSGWDFQSIDCSASKGVTPSTSGATVTFDIDAATDVLDCTYHNRARGIIVVEKVTDDGSGSFQFTSSTLAPSPFTLTTTAAGAGGKDSKTFSNLVPGTYDVAETVPAGWNLVPGTTCSDGSSPSNISLSAGETVTCTFHDTREQGAIKITKTRKHAADGSGDHPHAGVTFTVTGGELPAGGVTAVTNSSGVACVQGLVLSSFVGNYTVTESVPTGYSADNGPATVTVTTEATCGSGNEATTAFRNTPLTNITVSVDSQIDGGTASTIDCVLASGSTGANGDGSLTLSNLLPGTYICTMVVDP